MTTISTGTRSAMLLGSRGTSLKIPKPATKYIPLANPTESHQPGKGSSSEAPMIEGLKITIGIFYVLLSTSKCSAILLVNVYVFGN